MPAATSAFKSVGTFIEISATAPATLDAAGYGAITTTNWKEVGEVEDIGEYGPETQVNERTPLKSGIVQKLAGKTNYGDLPLQMAFVRGDSGHVLFESSRKAGTVLSVRVNWADGTKEYFRALPTSYKRAPGNADGFAAATANLSLTSDIVTVDPV